MKIKPSPKLNYENKPETIYYEDETMKINRPQNHHFDGWYVYHSQMVGLWQCFNHITRNHMQIIIRIIYGAETFKNPWETMKNQYEIIMDY